MAISSPSHSREMEYHHREVDMQILTTDVLIVGSGFGAAVPALRLCNAGLNVLMIEKGPDIDPQRDLKQTQDPQYLMKYLKGLGAESLGFTYAEGLGGGSTFYEMVCLRAPSKVFDQTDTHGTRYWPKNISRSTMDPFYAKAERMMNVHQIPMDRVPKTGAVFARLFMDLGYSCDRARYASKDCIGAGFCVTGCIFGAKQSLHENYLPRAREAGLNVRTNLEALFIRPLTTSLTVEDREMNAIPLRYEVFCRDPETGEEIGIQTRLLILGGGTVGTAKLLLNSKTNLPRLSPHVGRNIAFNGSVKTVGLLAPHLPDGDMFTGQSHPGVISYEFFDSHGVTISCAKPLPIDVQASAHLVLEHETRTPAKWGSVHLELMKQFRRRMIVLYALGLTPPVAEIRRSGGGRFSVELNLTDSIRTYYHDTKEMMNSILRRNGCSIIIPKFVTYEGKEYEDIRFTTTHMVGSARMGDNPHKSVVDANGEMHFYPGIFVTDGAAIPTSLAVNSALTITANAERIAEQLAMDYGRQPIIEVNTRTDRSGVGE